MKIGVLLKQVPDTATKIKIREDAKGIVTDDIKWIVNPYDEFAVEEALKLKAKVGNGEVVIVTVGPERAQEAMRTGLAMGADRGIHLCDDAFLGSDTLAIAKAVAAAIKEEKFDILFGGKMGVDSDMAQMTQTLAEVMGVPHVQPIEHFEISADHKTAHVHRVVGGGNKEVLDIQLPAIFGCEKGLNEPRYASLPGIMKAKSKPIKTVSLADTGLSAQQVGATNAQIRLEKLEAPPERQAGKIIEGESDETAKQLIDLLRNEAKVV
jgi:electron transfer flavoprotein beta subunit